jgi:hypothetical protein
MTCRVPQCPGGRQRIGRVQSTNNLMQVHRDALDYARCKTQYLALARRAGQASGLERPDRSRPVHKGKRPSGLGVLEDHDELADEVVSQQPAAVTDQQLYGRLSTEHARGVFSQRRRKVLEAGSK